MSQADAAPPADPSAALRARLEDPRLQAALVAIAAGALYAANLDDFYVSDDFDHPFFRGLSWGELARRLVQPSGPGEFFRPLTRLSMGLDYALFGRAPGASHAINLALHAGCAALLYALARRITGQATVALVAGLLFAAHPAHPEAVSFLGGRFDLVSAVCALGAMLAHVRWAESGSRRWAAASAALALGSVLGKEASVLLPLALLAYELACAPERRLRRLLPSLAVVALYAAHRALVVGSLSGYSDSTGMSRHVPTLDAAFVEESARFLGYGLFTPVNRMALGSWASPAVFALGALTALALSGLLTPGRPRRSFRGAALLGLALALASAAPASSLFSSWGLALRLEGSRFVYLASAGSSLLLAVSLSGVSPPALRRGLTGALLALSATLTVLHTLPWSHASELTQRSIAAIARECAHVTPGGFVLLDDAPDHFQGAYVWRNGLGSAIAELHPAHPETRFMHAELEADFEESAGFDLREFGGNPSVCLLRWDERRATFRDDSAALRAASPVPRVGTLDAPPFERWEAYNANRATLRRGRWSLEASNEDLHIVAPPLPLAVRAVVMEITVRGADPAEGHGEVFWAFGETAFEEELHHRFFDLVLDGRPHRYRFPLPATRTEELSEETLRFRVDPITWPGAVEIGEVTLEAR